MVIGMGNGKIRWLTEFMLLSVVLFWGMNYTIGKFGMRQLSPIQFNAIRFAVTAPLLLIAAYVVERSLRIRWHDLPRLILLSLIGVSLYQSLFMLSVRDTSATNASLLIAMSPVFAGIFSVVSKQERFTWKKQFGSLIAFSGAALVLLNPSSPHQHAPDAMIGNIAGLLASIAWGIYPIITAPLLQRYSSLRITAWSAVFGVIPLWVVSQGTGSTSVQLWSMPTWLSLAFSIFVVTIYGLVAWYVGVSRIGATQVMVYMYLIPVVAIVFAAFFIHETIYPSQVVGGLIIFAGIAMVKNLHVSRRSPRHAQDPPDENTDSPQSHR